MATLGSINGASLVPDIRPLTAAIENQAQRRQIAQDEQQNMALAEQLAAEDDVMSLLNNPDLIRLSQRAPQLSKTLLDIALINDERAASAAREEIAAQAQFAASLLPLSNDDRIVTLQQRSMELMRDAQNSENPQDLIGDAQELAELAQLGAENPAILQQRLIEEGSASELGLNFLKSAMKPTTMDAVQSSDILPDGTVVTVFKSGNSTVLDPEGNPLTGTARRDAIKTAQEFGVSIQGERAGARTSTSEASKQASDYFKQLNQIRGNIRKFNRGIRLLEEGAKTGRVESLLPSFRAASIKLDQLQNELGLDVVGSTTFGALSKDELELALNTGLPKKLDEAQLLKWMVDKRAAQQKLAAYIEEAAIFLDQPGNTIGDFLERERSSRQSMSSPEGMIDNGDGTFTLSDGTIIRRKTP